MAFYEKARTVSKGKILLSLALIILLISIFSVGVLAQTQKIGYINLTQVIASHPNSEKIIELEKELMTELQTRQAKLNQEGKGLEELELKKLEEEFNKEWDPVKQKIIAQRQALQAERNSDVLKAISVVGEEKQYQLIINREVPVFTGSEINEYPVVLYGGDNLTQDVIAVLGKIINGK